MLNCQLSVTLANKNVTSCCLSVASRCPSCTAHLTAGMLKPWRGDCPAAVGAAAAAAVRSAAAADAGGMSVLCESKLLKLKEVIFILQKEIGALLKPAQLSLW